ncbi:hypothetical protein [Deinococcus hopiensis]|uniref:Uncharacterized protein n=1 Tax=Deinococcus hopiensis KR-140 TaxID=695939 RepID=A0A1W1VKF5_9DEIO|nr:hypothetical protein [Deinococcus hopiensis]SMB93849.1 hypothetical protein SAMN00790413_02143 [Deinococcus hopiensis KR-140]
MGFAAVALLSSVVFLVLPFALVRTILREYGEASVPEREALLLALRALLLFGCTLVVVPFFIYGATAALWLPIAAAVLLLTVVPTPMLLVSLWRLRQLRALDTSRLRPVRASLFLTTPVSLLGGWWALSILQLVMNAKG